MRVATSNAYQTSVSMLQERQQALQTAQEQMTSGKRIAKPSDDPAGMAAAERALIAQKRGESAQRALAASRNAMTLSESAIGQAGDLVQDAREALVSAGNGSYSAAERSTLARQIRELRGQLYTLANQGDGANGYLFGGQGATTKPFADTPGGVQPMASGGAANASASEKLPLSVDGQAVWLQADSGNGVFETSAQTLNTGAAWIDAGQVTDPSALQGLGYTLSFSHGGSGTTYSVSDQNGNTVVPATPYVDGKSITGVPGMAFTIKGAPADGDSFDILPSQPRLSVFDALDKVLATLENKNANSGQVMQAVNAGMRDMDQVLGNFQSARAMVGETLNRLDTMESRNSAAILSAQTTRSNAEDVDMVQAVSDFSNKQTSYQAALQSYASVQKLSLFKYINT
jgi:flagellar hook-associated protein 3 FlgL